MDVAVVDSGMQVLPTSPVPPNLLFLDVEGHEINHAGIDAINQLTCPK
jgi:hypothetical protein